MFCLSHETGRTREHHHRGGLPALSPATDRLIDLRLVQDRCGRISRTTVWRLMRDADFPRPAAVGARHLWSDREVSAWIARRLANRPGRR